MKISKTQIFRWKQKKYKTDFLGWRQTDALEMTKLSQD